LTNINDTSSLSDVDGEGQTLTYSLDASNSAAVLSAVEIDPTTGSLIVKNPAAFDFETFQVNGLANFQVVVRATDSDANFDTGIVSFGITNVNEVPLITSGTTVSYTEMQPTTVPVFTVQTLPDYQDITTFSILPGLDGSSFVINNSTGLLTFVQSPVYNQKSVYRLDIQAIDNVGNTHHAVFTVNIVDVTAPLAPIVNSVITNDNTPVITGTAEAGSTITVFVNNQTYTTIATNTGLWSVTLTTNLPDATYTISTTARDAAGNNSPATTASVVVYTRAPLVTVVQPTCSVATGSITITNPLLSGLRFSINNSDYTNVSGQFVSLVSGVYNVTIKFSDGSVSIPAVVTIISQSSLICDSDGDSVIDTQEVTDNTNSNDYCSFNPLSVVYANTSVSWKNADCDSDGLTNTQEIQIGLDLLNPDMDGDGVKDGQEITDQTDPNNSCDSVPAHVTLPFSTSFLSGDCDSDGLTNAQELGTNPTIPTDVDTNGVPDYLEFNNHSTSEDDLEVFNSITNNDDNLNDAFIIRGIEQYPDNTLIIYNRWGVEVYNVDGYGQDDKYFRGLSEGRKTISQSAELPKGTYYYLLRYVNKQGVQKQRSGYLYITK
jgi:gliding motility-associated-like protein